MGEINIHEGIPEWDFDTQEDEGADGLQFIDGVLPSDGDLQSDTDQAEPGEDEDDDNAEPTDNGVDLEDLA